MTPRPRRSRARVDFTPRLRAILRADQSRSDTVAAMARGRWSKKLMVTPMAVRARFNLGLRRDDVTLLVDTLVLQALRCEAHFGHQIFRAGQHSIEADELFEEVGGWMDDVGVLNPKGGD